MNLPDNPWVTLELGGIWCMLCVFMVLSAGSIGKEQRKHALDVPVFEFAHVPYVATRNPIVRNLFDSRVIEVVPAEWERRGGIDEVLKGIVGVVLMLQ